MLGGFGVPGGFDPGSFAGGFGDILSNLFGGGRRARRSPRPGGRPAASAAVVRGRSAAATWRPRSR